MANKSAYRGGRPIIGAAGGNAAGLPAHVVLSNVIDAGEIADGAAVNDTVDVMEIPANTLVTGVFLEVVEGEASVLLALGVLGEDPDGFLAASSAAASGITQGGGALLGAAGAFRTAATMLSATVTGAALTNAVIRVVVTGVNVG